MGNTAATRADFDHVDHWDTHWQAAAIFELVDTRDLQLVLLVQLFDHLPELFDAAYASVFSLSYLDEPIEVIHWKVDLSGPAPKFDGRWSTRNRVAGQISKGKRRAYFPEAGGFVDCPVYNRYALTADVLVTGPAIVEERESTCVLGVGDQARIDGFGNLITEIALA